MLFAQIVPFLPLLVVTLVVTVVTLALVNWFRKQSQSLAEIKKEVAQIKSSLEELENRH